MMLEDERIPLTTAEQNRDISDPNIISYRDALKNMAVLGLPIAIGQFFAVSVPFIESVMMARSGSEDVAAASGLIEPIAGILHLTTKSYFTWVSLLASKELQEGNLDRVNIIIRQAYIQALIITAIFTPIILNLEPLLISLGQDPTIASITQQYYYGYIGGFLPFLGLTINRNLFNAWRKSHLSLVLYVLNAICSLLVGYLLMFGKGGWPNLGVLGLGLSNTISITFFFLASCLYIRLRPAFKDFKFLGSPFLDKSLLKTSTKMGLLIASTSVIDLFSSIVASLQIGAINGLYLISQGFASQYKLLSMAPSLALLESSVVLTKRALSAQKLKNMRIYVNAAAILGLVITTVFSIIYSSIPEALLGVLFPEQLPNDVVQQFINIMYVNAAFSLIDSIRIIMHSGLYVNNDLLSPIFISFITMIVMAVPLSAIVSFLSQSPTLINVARGVSFTVGAGLIANRWNYVDEMVVAASTNSNHQGFLWKTMRKAATIFGTYIPPNTGPIPPADEARSQP